ncbi:MAG: xanthine dehydrogenase family protein subunit M [Myxococcales bacterium]|nr:FAD binding domain-containing protein [Myxococcales bacterium]
MIPVTSARSLSEAYAILHQRPRGLRVLAGGTDLMVAVNARAGLDRIGHVLDIWKVPELRGISGAGGSLRIGALTTYTELMRSREIATHLPALALVSREVGAWAIQNRGTIGGNVCNASPAGDTLPLLLAAEATFLLGGPRGERTVAAHEFFVGYRKTALGADELLLRVDIPLIEKSHLVYRKVGTRKAQSISRTIVAVRKLAPRDVRIAAGCVAPIPLRCRNAEKAVAAGGDVRAALEQDITPIDDVRATAVYRSRVTGNVLLRLLG